MGDDRRQAQERHMFAAVRLHVMPPIVAVIRRQHTGFLPELMQGRAQDDQDGEGR